MYPVAKFYSYNPITTTPLSGGRKIDVGIPNDTFEKIHDGGKPPTYLEEASYKLFSILFKNN